MIKQNKLIVKPVMQFAVACAAMTFVPQYWGAQSLRAEVLNVQQSKAIKGNIVDENGEPVIGATIMVVGGSTPQGTVSDFDGNFKMNAKAGQKLKITYIGCDDVGVAAKDGM